jgi:hypothetical protein
MMKNRRLANTVLGLCLAAGPMEWLASTALSSNNAASSDQGTVVTLAVQQRTNDNSGPR